MSVFFDFRHDLSPEPLSSKCTAHHSFWPVTSHVCSASQSWIHWCWVYVFSENHHRGYWKSWIIVSFICPNQAYHLFLIKLLFTLHSNPLSPLAATAKNRMEREAVKLPPVVLNRPLITPSLDIAQARLVWTSMSFLPSCRISWCSPVSALGWSCFKY